MTKKRRHNRIWIILIFVFCIAIVCGSIAAPRYLLLQTVEAETERVHEIPEEYYVEAGDAMARNTSESLSAIDRVKLISGEWESNMRKCEITEGFLDEVEAVALAKNQMELYYDQGVFPYSIQTKYENLYSYSSELYCFTDSNFRTYSAYLWKIVFTKYDKSIQNIIYMTESGTILLAWTNSRHYMSKNMLDCYKYMSIREIFGDKNLYTADVVKHKPVSTITIPYPDVEQPVEIDNGALITVRVSGTLEQFAAFQYTTENGFGIVFMPNSSK